MSNAKRRSPPEPEAIAATPDQIREAYLALFDTPLDWPTLDAIRRAANKSKVLGIGDHSPLLDSSGESVS